MGYRVADTFMKVLLVTLLENYSVALETDVRGDDDSAVSYTHLTLPTNREV